MSNSNSKAFSVTFWIEKHKNSAWESNDSNIIFNPLPVNTSSFKGFVVFVKRGVYLNAYVYENEKLIMKISTDIEKHLGKRTFVALTWENHLASLYLDAELVKKKKGESPLEIGDIVFAPISINELESFAPLEELPTANTNSGLVSLFAEIIAFSSDKAIVRLLAFDKISMIPLSVLQNK